MAVDLYKDLRKSLLILLKDFAKTKKKMKKVGQIASKIGGPIKKESAKIIKEFDLFERKILRLEQETREI